MSKTTSVTIDMNSVTWAIVEFKFKTVTIKTAGGKFKPVVWTICPNGAIHLDGDWLDRYCELPQSVINWVNITLTPLIPQLHKLLNQ